jgi:hypothetical protein
MILDTNSSVYITTTSGSSDLPVTPFAYQNESNHPNLLEPDGHISKISSDLSHVLYSTYFGSPGTDVVNGVTVNSFGDIYFTGYTTSADFPQKNIEFEYKNSRDIIFVKMGNLPFESRNAIGFNIFHIVGFLILMVLVNTRIKKFK